MTHACIRPRMPAAVFIAVLATLWPAEAQTRTVDLFPVQAATPDVPAALATPPTAPAPPPLAAPAPPPLPFSIAAMWRPQGEPPRILLVADRTRVVVCRHCRAPEAVRPGQMLAPNYRLVNIDDQNVTIEFIPLKAQQTLPLHP